MMIADGAECPERLRVASLIQLKNVLPRRIHSEEYPIGEHELAIIR